MKGKFLAAFLLEAASVVRDHPVAVAGLMVAGAKALDASEDWDAAKQVAYDFAAQAREENAIAREELRTRRKEALAVRGLIERAAQVNVTCNVRGKTE